MNGYRHRAMLYAAEVVLAVGLLLLPVRHDLPVLTAIGLLLHLSTSLGMLPFQWRVTGMGADRNALFGVPNRLLVVAVIAAGAMLMASWPFGHSTPAWIAGVVLLSAGIEELVT